MKLKIQNPNTLKIEEQARRYRKLHRMVWKRFSLILDGKEDFDYLARKIAQEVTDELLYPMIRKVTNPEIAWDADVTRKGYTITVKPKEGRMEPILGE